MGLAALILAVAALALLAQALRLARRWSRGAPAGVDLRAGLRRLPRAYLHSVHDVMAREPRVARMHALVAGGTLAAILLAFLQAASGLAPVAALVVAASAAALAGAGIDAARRASGRPARLPGGDFDRLPYALAAFHAGLILSALGVWWGTWGTWAVWSGAVLLAGAAGWLVLKAARGPMRHAVAGVAHLVAHPRPERLDDLPATALRPVPEDAGHHGPACAEDFGWNRLAMFDACIQCGKCEAACPAFAAGQPLNPRKLVNDIAVALGAGGIGTEYAGAPHPPAQETLPLDDLVPDLGAGPVAPEALWSCTTCRACVEACPMLIEHVDAVVDLRRSEVLDRGTAPGGVTTTLLALRETDTAAHRALEDRYDWAVDLDLRVLEEGGTCDVLLWAGDSAFELRSQATLRALVRLLTHAGVDVAVLGAAERDSGDLARRLGDEATFEALARANMAELSARRIGRIVSADPHAVHCLSREYPAFGPMPPVLHHTQLLEQLAATGALTLPPPGPGQAARVTYHDPCYLGRYLGETDAPRSLLARLGVETAEMAESGRASRCCGGGGGAPAADIPGKARIPDIRMDQARATGAGIVAAACPYCTQMLEGVSGARPEVRDIAELLWDRIAAGQEAAR